MNLLYFALGTAEDRQEQKKILDLPGRHRNRPRTAEHLRERGGGYGEAFAELARLRAAVNQEHVYRSMRQVAPDDEVAFFPPVTGG